MARDKIDYEWVAEELDEHGDIIDPMYGDTLAEVMGFIEPAANVEYALMRREGNDADGENYREYTYLVDGKLPLKFPDGYRVPLRFHREVKSTLGPLATTVHRLGVD